MKKELYHTFDEALEEAEKIADLQGGYIVEKQEAVVDDRTDFDYISSEMRNIIWSGEITAIIVRDEDTNEDIAWLAYYSTDRPVEATWKTYNGNTEVFFNSYRPLNVYGYSLSHTGDDAIAYEDKYGIRTREAMEQWADDMVNEIESSLLEEDENIVFSNKEDLRDHLLMYIEQYTNDD